MTDSTGKNASMNADDCPWTDEEIDKMIAKDTLIKMKCTACGHIANVPDWIIGEFAEHELLILHDLLKIIHLILTQL